MPVKKKEKRKDNAESFLLVSAGWTASDFLVMTVIDFSPCLPLFCVYSVFLSV